MAKKEEQTIIEKIYDYTLEDIMGDRFGRYSKSIIQDRALPDVRDGLKPVQRRILYTMWEDKNTYDKPYRKCAKAVGDVMGKYHPHGDSSIYGAMINMSQKWKMREMFIDIHGNNGSIDGDGPAAYRYTETRLTKLSGVMLKYIERDSVEMALNYSDDYLEPTVLPANFPNLLVNGSQGISAGYATNIPPHNLTEVIDATIHRIDNPNSRLDTILGIIKGPDFPTGGVIEGKEGLRQAYETGKGKVVLKAKTEIIKDKKGHRIVIHEIPYDVLKEPLRKKIEDIKIDKKVDGIVDVKDESDKENMAKLIIELKKDANAELILNYLFKNTDLQINYNFNIVAICDRRPKQLGLLAILDAFIAHQKEVILRRTRYDLKKAEERLHIVEGFLKAVDILDEVIKLIRASKNRSDCITNLVKEFKFTDLQATAIVDMRLYKLSNTDVNLLLEEQGNLQKMIEFLNSILNNESILKTQMKKELNEIKKEYGNERRTEVRDEISDIKIDLKDMIPKENTIVVVTKEGYIKRVSPKSYTDEEETVMKPGDYVIGLYDTTTLNNIMLFTNLGRYCFIPVHQIPEGKWKELGKHVNNVCMLSPDEKIISSVIYDSDNSLLVFATKDGMVKKTYFKEFVVQRYSKPLTAIKLKESDELVTASKCEENSTVIMVSKNGYYDKYSLSEVTAIGTKAAGVKGMNLKDDELVSLSVVKEADEYLNVATNNKTAKRIKLSDLYMMTRAKKGMLLMKKVKTQDYHIIDAFTSESRDNVCLKSDSEIREIKNSDIAIMDTQSTGSSISKYMVEKVFVKANIEKVKDVEIADEPVESSEVPKEDTSKEEVKEFTLDDFIDDFKI
ncbi:MAG: DNA topoisomerase IV subunit A [Bacilli bacterium]|nr:DNA topoisomerase IV subunit A [Bacilli bacterium]